MSTRTHRRAPALAITLAIVLIPSRSFTRSTDAGAPTSADAPGRSERSLYLPALLRGVRVDGSLPLLPGGGVAIGLTNEPDTLYLYSGDDRGAQVLDLLYDGPIDFVGHDHRPSVVERLPRVEDGPGDASVDHVTVRRGEPYVDPDSGEVVTATATITGLVQITTRFRLVDGLTWEDGVAVTADDSVWSRALACDPDTPTSKRVCERTAHYVALDARSVEWRGLPGFTDPESFTRFYTPLPRHQRGGAGRPMGAMTAAEILQDPVFTRQPLSYGPFRITAWLPGAVLRTERNPHYWRRAEGLPRLDDVAFRFLPCGACVVDRLVSGLIDVLPRTRARDVDVARLVADGGVRFRVRWVPRPLWDHIDFNVDPFDPLHGDPPLGACQAFRQAVAFGTDRAQMAELLNRGATPVWEGLTPAGHWAAPADAPRYPFDPDAARARLSTLGFEDTDGDGIREAVRAVRCSVVAGPDGATREHVIATGTVAHLTLQTTMDNPLREGLALLFQSNMKDIGIAVDLELLPAGLLFEDGPRGPVFGRTYALALFGWRSGYLPPVSLYRCDEIPDPANGWAGQNNTGWCDPAYDRAADAVDAALDRASARRASAEAQRILVDQMPALPVLQRLDVAAARSDLVFFRPDPTALSDTWNVEAWAFAVGGEAR